MMISDGIRQEVGKIVDSDADLRAAKHFAERRIENPRVIDIIARQISGTFEERTRSRVKTPLNRCADPGFKMCV